MLRVRALKFTPILNSGRQDIKFYNKLIYYILYNI